MPLPSQSVSARPRSDQPFFAFVIAGLSCALSLWLTLRFCRHLWPEEGGFLLVLLGVTWESAKLYFGPIGIYGLCAGGYRQRIGSLLLATMSLILMAGSVVASIVYLSQADAQDQQRGITSSRAYAEAQALLRSLDAQIGTLLVAASRDVDQNFRKRALATSEAITNLRRQREDVSAGIARMEMHPEALASTPFFASLGRLLPGDANANAKTIRYGAHGVVAVMLELIGVSALCVARLHHGAKAVTAEPRNPATATCIRSCASTHLSKGDAGGASDIVSVHPTRGDARDASRMASMHSGTADARMHLADARDASPSAFMHPGTADVWRWMADAKSETAIVSAHLDQPDGWMHLENAKDASDVASVNRDKADAKTRLKDAISASEAASVPPDQADASMHSTDAKASSHQVHLKRLDAALHQPRASEATSIASVHLTNMPRQRGHAKSGSGTCLSDLPAKLKRARELVIQSQVAPTYRGLQQALKIGQAAAQRLLIDMQSDGLLKRVGRGYELVG